MSIGAKMVVTGKGHLAQVAIIIAGEDRLEISVKDMISDELIRLPQGLMRSKN